MNDPVISWGVAGLVLAAAMAIVAAVTAIALRLAARPRRRASRFPAEVPVVLRRGEEPGGDITPLGR